MSYLAFYFDQMSYSTICRIDELSYSTNCRVDELVFDEMSGKRCNRVNVNQTVPFFGQLRYLFHVLTFFFFFFSLGNILL